LAWVYRYFSGITWDKVTPIKTVAKRLGITEIATLKLLQRLRQCWPDIAPKKKSISKTNYVFDETRDSEPRIRF